jgi:hypothetical protein
MFLAVFFGILAAVAVIGAIFQVSRLMEQSEKAAAERRGLPALRMRTIATACIVYDSTYGGYPEHLSDLGFAPSAPSNEHAGLIDEILASGKIDGFLVVYTPTKRESHGRPVGYTVTMTRDKPRQFYPYNYFVDETGVIRFTSEVRPAAATDPPII